MNIAGRITEIIFAAMQESNASAAPERALKLATTTLLFGKTSKLDSAGLVNLVASIDEGIERVFHIPLSVFDIILSGDREHWTVADLVTDIKHELPPVQTSEALA